MPFIQKSCSNCCGILFRAWFDTDWIWVPCLRMFRLCFYLFFFIIWMLHAASWICFFVLSVCSFMHAPCHYFSIGVKNFPPRQHVSLPWTSIAGTCTTWQRIASSTMRDSTKHDFRAHIVVLFHKKKVKEGGKKILTLD